MYSDRVITKRKLKLISQMPMVFMFNKESGYSRMWAGGFPRILGGLHFPVLVIGEHIVLRVLRRAGAEQEGEEEEGH